MSDSARPGRATPDTHYPRTIAELRPGDHVCCLYETEEEHRTVLMPFLRQGLERGEKVLYIVDAHTVEAVLGYLRDDGLHVETYLARGQLAILSRNEAYMQQGVFDPDGMIALLRAETEIDLAQGYPALRVTGEMSWALRGLPGSERLIEHEAKLNEFFPGSNCLAICQYDRRAFSPALLLDVLYTHPIVIVGTAVYDNFYYVPPADLLSDDPPGAQLRRWVEHLTERKQMMDALSAKTQEYIATTNSTGDMIAKLDKHGNWAFLNDAACQFYGKPREELLGTDSRASVHPDDLEPTAQAIRETRATKKLVRGFVHRQFTPMGTRVVEWNGFALFDEDGQYAGVQITGRDISERREAEERIRESEEKFKNIFQSASDSIIYLDTSGTILDVNDEAVELFGGPREELVGTHFTEVGIFQPSDLPTLMANLAGMLSGKKPSVEICIKDRAGQERFLDCSGSLLEGDGKAPHVLIVIARDITKRKRAETALRESEEKWRSLAQNAPNIILIVDRDGTIQFINRTVSGMTVEETLGRSVYDFVQPEYHRTMRESIEQVFHTGDVGTYQVMGAGPGGRPSWYETQFGPIKRGGQVVAATLITTDISERKRMEEALRESREHYRLLAENASDVIWATDLSLKYTYVSPSVTRLRGYSVEEVMGGTLRESLTPASLEIARKMLAEALAEDRERAAEPFESRTLEVELNCKDGSTVWTEIKVAFLRNPDGQAVGLLGVSRDISERKKAEAERERLHAELEVRAITDSLTGLYDHAHFYQRLAEEIERSKRYKHGFAVVMMDVDDFKRFNDSRGHQMGDAMLRLVADCVRAGLRSSDIPFRYDGDEFAAILPHADSSKAKAAVNRINGHIAKKLKQTDGGSATRLSLSAGVACFPGDGTTADVLVRLADAALYSAKWVARARDILGQREDIQSLISALASRRGGVEGSADGTIFRPEALHEQQARIVASVASSIAVALKDAGVSEALEDPDLQVLATVGAAAEIKDRYIRGHLERTSKVAAALAEEMGLPPEQVRNIKVAGLLHDIGKITVSESILNKPGKLTKREFANIKDHPIVGAALVSQVKDFEQLIPIVRHHHERFGGKGYPDGLAGEEIPLEARIMSVVDVFDALTHERSYRKALSREEALAELQRGAGTQFDPVVLEAFLALATSEGAGSAGLPPSGDKEPATVRATKT